ncbi:hypothetical protein ACRTEU_16100 [Vibrio alginolyticus]|uniref:hypothetical protein n=1 Tax=Vibrio alginolyticus TaxID=663 RepID=UPI001BD1F681|nr:hypothetical protein [Vibrio alginolyticus]MBT0012168.1 hypothetical protein [Vibrio alginolyticus]MBT0039891.1 hypothetical protein [Vibrio alginolyticus]
MNYQLPEGVTIESLPISTLYQLDRLLKGTTKPANVSRTKLNRKLAGDYQQCFEHGLALYLFRLIEEFNQNLKELG